jgi:tubulin monoglycylase TTLL3/8
MLNRESYIRFCTKPFVLEDFHESIHLCNNAIQCRYKNAETRDSALPDENMWDNYTFQAYLKTIGKFDVNMHKHCYTLHNVYVTLL